LHRKSFAPIRQDVPPVAELFDEPVGQLETNIPIAPQTTSAPRPTA
jgi:hypothetical protein